MKHICNVDHNLFLDKTEFMYNYSRVIASGEKTAADDFRGDTWVE